MVNQKDLQANDLGIMLKSVVHYFRYFKKFFLYYAEEGTYTHNLLTMYID